MLFFLNRSAVYAVISISRLQFITKRWHTGVRNTYHSHPTSQMPTVALPPREPSNFTSQYQPINTENVPVLNPTNVLVGGSNQASSSAFGIKRPVTPNSEENLIWSGSTPPSRDMGLRSPVRRNRLVRSTQTWFLSEAIIFIFTTPV